MATYTHTATVVPSGIQWYDVTIDDPGAYTRTWSSGWTLKWVPNEELPLYYCQDNRT